MFYEFFYIFSTLLYIKKHVLGVLDFPKRLHMDVKYNEPLRKIFVIGVGRRVNVRIFSACVPGWPGHSQDARLLP